MPIADPGAGAATPAPPLSVKEQEDSLKDGEGIISPLSFPEPSVSVDYVNAMASGLRELGTSIADTGNDITSSWGGLSGHYSAPESETLFSVLDPVATDGDTVGEELGRAARALENFAEDVADIKTRWSNLRVEAYDLRSRIEAEGDDWDKGGGFAGFGEAPLKEENDGLVEQGQKIITDYTEVENTCANAINAGIAGRTNFEKQPEGDAELDPNVFYHGFEQDLSELAVEWGHESAQTDYGWWVDASHSVWDFGVDAVQGVGAMVGAHSSEGWFQASWGDALKEYHWDNLTSAASLVGMYDAESDSLGPAGWDAVGQAWKDLAHSVVPWEEWGDRPGYVIGTAALNVIGLVGGAALTATGVGAVVGVPLMAWRGMAIVDGMGGSGRGGSGGGVDVDLPDVSHIPQFGGSGSPLINLAGRALDATGYGPSQLADLKNMVNRLMPSGQSGAEPAGAGSAHTGGEAEGGRPGSARPTPVSDEVDQRPIQRPVQDPTVADALAFDDIVNHPDNQAFGEQARSTRQGQIDEVDQAAKTGSNGTPASEEGRWTGGAGEGRGPDEGNGKVPEMAGGGRPSDTMEASAAKNPPAATERVRLTDTGEGRFFGNEIAESRGDHGADMRDRNPTVHNQDGDGPSPNKDGSSHNDVSGIGDDGKSSDEASNSRSPEPTVTPDPGHPGEERPLPSTREADSDVIKNSGLDFEDGRYPEGGLQKIPPNLDDGRILGRIPIEDPSRITKDADGLLDTVDGKPLEEWQANLLMERTLEIRALQLEEGFSFRSLGSKGGAVNSIVIDRRTGLVAEGMNGRSGKRGEIPQEKTHEIIQDRVEGMRGSYTQYDIIDGKKVERDQPSEFPHTDKPLRHAEVKAMNRHLKIRDSGEYGTRTASSEDIREMLVDNAFTFAERLGDCPCCANCTRITEGAPAPRSGKNTHNPHDPTNQRIQGEGNSHEGDTWRPMENDPFAGRSG